ncbi:MAG: hypothetical protein QG593_537, partial [Patescibacteria group bacterium]|jgi:hypothetical protein|nr:hypothetical protein [Patescibacteria group bacterium]
METQVQDIAKLNDRFRGMCLDVFYTAGVRDGIMDLIGLSQVVENFNNFDENNDPHGEHDFGSLFFEGKKIFWKIDYYDQDLKFWCDPLDKMCRRTLTIMLAEDY